MTKQNGPRYSDSHDFNEKHDEIVVWFMDNYERIVSDLLSTKENGILAVSADIKVEFPLNSFNIPDATVFGTYKVHHSGNFQIKELDFGKSYDPDLKWGVGCPGCRRRVDFVHEGERKVALPGFYKKADLIDYLVSELNIVIGDSQIPWHWKDDYYCLESGFMFVFEVKGYIRSFGETIRQLQSYRNVVEGKCPKSRERQDVFLVTPDGRYDAYFEQQGFKVLHPDILPVDKATSGKLEDFEGTNHKEAVR